MEDLDTVRKLLSNTGQIRTWEPLDQVRKVMLGKKLYTMCSAGGAPEALIKARIAQLNSNGCENCSLQQFVDLCQLKETDLPPSTSASAKRRFISDKVPYCLKRNSEGKEFNRMLCNVLEDPSSENEATTSTTQQQGCPLCQKAFTGTKPPYMLSCRHQFHSGCILAYAPKFGKVCPICTQKDELFPPFEQAKTTFRAALKTREPGGDKFILFTSALVNAYQRTLAHYLKTLGSMDEAKKAFVLREKQRRASMQLPAFQSINLAFSEELLDLVMSLDDSTLVMLGNSKAEELELNLNSFFNDPDLINKIEAAPMILSYTISYYMQYIAFLQAYIFNKSARIKNEKGLTILQSNALQQIYITIQSRAEYLEKLYVAYKALV